MQGADLAAARHLESTDLVISCSGIRYFSDMLREREREISERERHQSERERETSERERERDISDNLHVTGPREREREREREI